jgi:Domain of unknown function (DUF4252)
VKNCIWSNAKLKAQHLQVRSRINTKPDERSNHEITYKPQNAADHLAAKASQTVDVNLDGRLMRLASGIFSDNDADEKQIKKLIAGLKGIYVRSFEFETAGQYTAADLSTIRTQLRGPGWTRVVNVVSKKEGDVEVYLLMNGDLIGGLAVLHVEDKEITVVNIVGPVDLDKLAQLEGQFGVPELGLEKQKEKTKNDEK